MRLANTEIGRMTANRIMLHPDVYPHICDDHADPDHTQLGAAMLMNKMVWMVQPSQHVLLMAVPVSLTLYEVHTMIEPEGRGKQAILDVRKAAKWFFENPDNKCEKIFTLVPVMNRAAKIFAKKVGMVEQGTFTKSFKKDGLLHDQLILGLEKELFICQQQ